MLEVNAYYTVTVLLPASRMSCMLASCMKMKVFMERCRVCVCIDVSRQRRRLSEGHAAAAVVESTELRRRLLRRQEQQRQRPALVAATLRHDRRHVSDPDRLRASTVSLLQSRDQRARLTSFYSTAFVCSNVASIQRSTQRKNKTRLLSYIYCSVASFASAASLAFVAYLLAHFSCVACAVRHLRQVRKGQVELDCAAYVTCLAN